MATHPDDAELLREAATGDEDALATLVARHLAPLLTYARLVALTEAGATDAVRDGMAAVLGAVRGGGEPPADVGRALLVAVRAAALGRPPGLAAQEGSLEAALRQLPANQRDVLALRELGLSYDDAGDVIGLSAVGAARLAWRGSGRLRSLMTGEPGGVVLATRECDRVLTLLTLAEDRPLPDDIGAAVRRHAASCPPCRVSPVALADARALYRGGVPGGEVPAPVVPTVVDVKQAPAVETERHAARTRTGAAGAMAAAAAPPHGGRRRRRRAGVPVAGFVALLLASGAVAMTLSALDDGGEGPRAGAPPAALRIEPAPDVAPEEGEARPPRRSERRTDAAPRREARSADRDRAPSGAPQRSAPSPLRGRRSPASSCATRARATPTAPRPTRRRRSPSRRPPSSPMLPSPAPIRGPAPAPIPPRRPAAATRRRRPRPSRHGAVRERRAPRRASAATSRPATAAVRLRATPRPAAGPPQDVLAAARSDRR